MNKRKLCMRLWVCVRQRATHRQQHEYRGCEDIRGCFRQIHSQSIPGGCEFSVRNSHHHPSFYIHSQLGFTIHTSPASPREQTRPRMKFSTLENATSHKGGWQALCVLCSFRSKIFSLLSCLTAVQSHLPGLAVSGQTHLSS